MEASLFLAKLLGPILVVLGLAVLINRASYSQMAEELLKSRTSLYLSGVLALTAGIAILLVHNVWAWRWPVVITIVGWLMLIRGLGRLLLPQQVSEFALRLLGRGPGVMIVSGAVALVLGLILSWFGYFAGAA
jgi:hypothetical protein